MSRSPASIFTFTGSKPVTSGLNRSRSAGCVSFHVSYVRKSSGMHWKPPMFSSVWSASARTPCTFCGFVSGS